MKCKKHLEEMRGVEPGGVQGVFAADIFAAQLIGRTTILG